MKLSLNRKPFLTEFLIPISKISDKGIFTISKDCVECLSCSSFDKKEQTIILFSKFMGDFDLGSDVNEVKLNIPNVNKLINIFNFLREDSVTLLVDNNSISYSSTVSNVSFRYHLLEDNVLDAPTVKMEKIYDLGFTFECEIEGSTFKQILKGSSVADRTNKIYLYTKNNKVFGLLTDETLKNIDNIEFQLAGVYVGDDIKKKVPMNLEIYRIISTLNFDSVGLKINGNGVIMFEVKRDGYLLQYIVTSLVK